MADTRGNWTVQEWEAAVGEQLRAARIAEGLDQAGLAVRADVSLGAVKNLESGKGSSLKTVIRVVRALGRTDWLASLAPPITISPLALLAAKGSAIGPRRRVRVRRVREDE
ncbi:MAG: helix-turn-helix domain-containing protein [Actinomycetota bacterium]